MFTRYSQQKSVQETSVCWVRVCVCVCLSKTARDVEEEELRKMQRRKKRRAVERGEREEDLYKIHSECLKCDLGDLYLREHFFFYYYYFLSL